MSELLILETPGERVRELRRRVGISQAQLGARVGRTQAWVSQVERGGVELDKVSVVNELARALRCHPGEITRTRTGDPPGDRALEAAADLTRALRRLDLPVDDHPARPVQELARDLAELVRLRGRAAYTELGAPTADLVADLHAATAVADVHGREAAFSLLVHACKEAHSFAYGLGYPHLVELSSWRARWAAERSDDPLLPALADYLSARDAWTTADWSDAMLLLDRAARTIDDAGPKTAGAVSLEGAVHLRAAVTAARADNAPEAYARMDAAATAAERAEGADPYTLWFSAGNVGLHRVSVAIELGDGDEAVRRSRGLIVPSDIPPSRLAHHYLDTARGFVWVGDVEHGLAALERADHLAPQLVRHHPMAQATMRSLLRAERKSTRERLRTMATRLHVT